MQLSRYRALIWLGLWLGGILVAGDLGLRLVFGDADWRHPGITWHYVERAAGVVAAAEALQADDPAALPTAKLTVLLGTSAVLRDFDCQMLQASDADDRDWLVLGSAGSSIRRIEVAAQPLLHGTLAYKRVYIGFNPIMLWNGGPPTPLTDDLEDFLADLSPGSLRAPAERILTHSWLGKRWPRAFEQVRVGLYETRFALLGTLGQGARVTFPPLPETWEPFKMKPGDSADPNGLQRQWQEFAPRCGADGFRDNDAQVQALVRLVCDLRQRGAEVCIVLMPEHSRLRTAYDADAIAAVEAALTEAAGDAPLPVYDLRGVLDDEYFYDYTHLNMRGRARLSAVFPQYCEATAPPLALTIPGDRLLPIRAAADMMTSRERP